MCYPGNETVFNSDGQWDITDIRAKSSEIEYPDAPGKTYTDVCYRVSLRNEKQETVLFS